MNPTNITQSQLRNLARHGLARADLRRHHLAPLGFRAGYTEYQQDFIANALLAEKRERLVSEAVGTLSAVHIPVVLFKGISYAAWLYDDPAERPMADVDLMVQPSRHRAAREALVRIGFELRAEPGARSRLHHAMTLQRGSDIIDLHRNIAQSGRTRIDLPAVWRRTESCAERSDDARRMTVVDEALCHFTVIARTQLHVPAVSYVDGARLIARMSPTQHAELAARAHDYRVSRAVAAAIYMTRRLTERDYCGKQRRAGAIALPGPGEVIRYQLPGRVTQLVRKLMLLDGARDAATLLLAAAVERLPASHD